MPDFDFDQFSGKRIVLLQGPVGPFFRQLADALKAAGATVSKINFNAGDWFFFPRHAINYRGTMQAWPSWFRRFCENERVDAVLLFGDCRPIHRDAHAVAVDLGIDVGVFEEGYIRPNYVTLERHGVNGHSRLPRNAEAYHAQPACGYHEVEVGRTYWQMVWCVFVSPAGLPRTRSVSIQEIYTAILDSARPVDLFWWAPSRAWIGTDGVMMRQSTLDMEDLRKRRSLVITRKEAAEALGVDPRTITTSINEGTIPSVRLGRRVVIPREKFLALFADDTPGRES